MSKDSMAVVKGLYDAMADQDMRRFHELIHPECRMRQSDLLPWGGEYVGAKGFEEFMVNLKETLEPNAEMQHLMDDGEGRVVAIARAWGKVLATGREYDMPEVVVWTVRDGRVVNVEVYLDIPEILGTLASQPRNEAGRAVAGSR